MVAINEFSKNITNQLEMTNEMIVQQTLMSDKLFLKFGIEEDQFNKAVAEHNLY